MAEVTATLGPDTVVLVTDTPSNEWGHLPRVTFDDVAVEVGWVPPTAGRDAAVVASCNHLIDALVALRDAAAERIRVAELAAIDAESPAEGHEVIAEWTREATA